MTESTAILFNHVQSLGYCPCCQQNDECIEECTIEKDSYDAGGSAIEFYGMMIEARKVLQAYKQQVEKEDKCANGN